MPLMSPTSGPLANRPSKHCHVLVAEVAKGLCHELYDTLMGENEFYSRWIELTPGLSAKAREEAFVSRNWGALLPKARAIMATMLRGPYDSATKSRIHEALCLDATLIRGRASVAPLIKPLEP